MTFFPSNSKLLPRSFTISNPEGVPMSRNSYAVEYKHLGSAIKDLLIIRVLLRIANKERQKTPLSSQEDCLAKIGEQLKKRAQEEILLFLEETEIHNLYFDDLDQLLSVFSWVQKKTEETLRERGTKQHERLRKTDLFWENVYSISCQLFGFFQNHWGCFCTEQETVPIQSAQITIRTFEIIYKLMRIVPPCKVFHLVQTAHQTSIELTQIERLVLAHVPVRIDDFTQLMADKILTPKTSRLFLKYPELIDALSYEGIRHLFTRWKESGSKTDILVFAQSIRHELYPDTLPDGIKIVWEILEHPQLDSFLHALYRKTRSEESFSFPDHAYAPGLYQPSNALILLPPPVCVSYTNEKISPTKGERDKEESPIREKSLDVEHPWNVVTSLIQEDLNETLTTSLTEDSDLVGLIQEMEAVHHLLNQVRTGDVDGVLDCWISWIDPIRDRIRKLDGRLKRIEPAATIPPILKEEAVLTAVQIQSFQRQEPPPVQELAPSVEIPAESQLVTQTRELLAKLPSGSMRRQLKKKLDQLIEETSQGEDSSLKAGFLNLQGEIQSLLDVLS